MNAGFGRWRSGTARRATQHRIEKFAPTNMGLARSAIQLIAETIRDHRISGRVLIIGKQDVWGTEIEVIRWLRECGLTADLRDSDQQPA